MKYQFRSYWEGQGAYMAILGPLDAPAFRTAWEISDEQFQKIQDIQRLMVGRRMDALEIRKILESPENVKALAETKDFETYQERESTLVMNALCEAIGNVLTAEQRQKMMETQLANMAEKKIVSLHMFDALNLTDTQKQQMGKIKKELEPEFEKTLDDVANGHAILTNKVSDERAKLGSAQSMQEVLEGTRAARKKLLKEDPEYKKISEEIKTHEQALAAQFRTKMFDVLTDEQRSRLQKLMDGPPEHVKVFFNTVKERSGEMPE